MLVHCRPFMSNQRSKFKREAQPFPPPVFAISHPRGLVLVLLRSRDAFQTAIVGSL